MRPAPRHALGALAALALLAAPPARAGLDAALRALPARTPPESLGRVLAGWEQRGTPGVRPGEAGYALGQFRYARGEFEPAAGAFLRAAARLGGEERTSARYGWALATFALGHAAAARAAFAEVAREGGPFKSLGELGEAQCLVAQGETEPAFAALQKLLAGEPGEAGPPALEALAALADRTHRDLDAAEARRRLAREYPRSLEAARAAGAGPRRAAAAGR